MLKTGRIADVGSLHWVQATEATGPGLTVKVRNRKSINLYSIKQGYM